MTKKFLDTLNGNLHDTPPLWLMRQAGRYLPEYRETRQQAGSFLDLCYNPALATEVTLQPIRRFGFDASIIFSDILVIPHALGMQLDYVQGEGPQLGKISLPEAVLELKRVGVVTRLAPVMEALKLVKAALPEETALIGFAGAPWTVAAYMLEGGGSKDFATARGFAYHHPEIFKVLLALLAEVTADYLIAQIDAGAEAVQLFDSWAGMVPGEYFRKWVITPTELIRDRVKSVHPKVPFIGFPKGAGLWLEDYVKETDVDAVSIDFSLPLDWVAERIQPHCCVQGNLDPALLANGTPQGIKTAVKRIKQVWGGKPYVFNLGHGILPHTPIEHVEILIEAVRGS